MYTDWSDSRSTIGQVLWQSIDEHIQSMHDVIEEERGEKSLSIIAVVPEEGLDELTKLSKKRWWQFWKGASLVSVTTENGLQRTIRRVSKDKKCRRRMIIMATTDVKDIIFRVPQSVKSLQILRCGHEEDPEGQLVVRGTAMFANTRLSDWNLACRKGRKLYIGLGVVIGVGASQLSLWADSTDSMSFGQQQKIKSYMGRMARNDMNRGWWEDWKGLIAGITGVAVTGTKLGASIKASASGFYFSVNALGLGSLNLGSGHAAMSGIMTAAGPAVLLGATTAAAVYFIPWNDVLTWLKTAFSFFWSGLRSFWEMVKSWITESLGGTCVRMNRS